MHCIFWVLGTYRRPKRYRFPDIGTKKVYSILHLNKRPHFTGNVSFRASSFGSRCHVRSLLLFLLWTLRVKLVTSGNKSLGHRPLPLIGHLVIGTRHLLFWRVMEL